MAGLLKWLSGKKAYAVAIAIAVVEGLHALGYLDTAARDAWLVILGAGGVAAIRSAVGSEAKKAAENVVKRL